MDYFNGARSVSSLGNATARFIGNDWQRSTRGEVYQTLLGGSDGELVRKLDEISSCYAFLLAKTADSKGWARDEQGPDEDLRSSR